MIGAGTALGAALLLARFGSEQAPSALAFIVLVAGAYQLSKEENLTLEWGFVHPDYVTPDDPHPPWTAAAVHVITPAPLFLDRADTLILGCMSMGFLNVAEEMSETLGVPVINPGRASLKMAEALVGAGLVHSKVAFMTPPKIASGEVESSADLMVRKGSRYSEAHPR